MAREWKQLINTTKLSCNLRDTHFSLLSMPCTLHLLTCAHNLSKLASVFWLALLNAKLLAGSTQLGKLRLESRPLHDTAQKS